MSTPVRAISTTTHNARANRPNSRPRAAKASDPKSFSRTLRARLGLPTGHQAVAGQHRGAGVGVRSAAPSQAHPGSKGEGPPLPPLAPRGQREQGDSRHDHDPRAPAPLLDPLARTFAHGQLHLAQPAPPPAALPPTVSLVHLDQMMTKLVRKVAWGGDGERGAARIELGAGELAGATIIVQSDHGALSVDVELPPGAAADVWRERLEKRFKGRGFNLVELNVR